MRVKIEITLDIDPAAWTGEYGIEGTHAIREDVKRWAENALTSHADTLGLLRA